MTARDDATRLDDVPIEVLLDVIAEGLTAWQPASNDALAALVLTGGTCLDDQGDGEPPGWLFDDTTDRAFGALICADCPVSVACLELELRIFGAAQLGMWGPLGEDGRRALHPLWLQARQTGGGQ